MFNKGEIIYFEDYIQGNDRSLVQKVWSFILSSVLTQEIKPTDEFVLIQEIKVWFLYFQMIITYCFV